MIRFLIPLLCVIAPMLADQAATDGGLPNPSCAAGNKRQQLTAREMFEYVNQERKHFEKHAPYEGYPWQGTYSTSMTWPVTFTWSEQLARKAEAEVARLAAGGKTAGRQFKHQLAGLYGERVESVWLSGLDTPEYSVTGYSRPETEPENSWHAFNNGTMRLAVLYQTGGRAPKTRVGIGKACLASGEAWWVLLFGD